MSICIVLNCNDSNEMSMDMTEMTIFCFELLLKISGPTVPWSASFLRYIFYFEEPMNGTSGEDFVITSATVEH